MIRRKIFWPRLLHPLTAILAVQAGLSLTLVWNNTAFNDEAEYLSAGRLEISHWLHGTHIPATFGGLFSGSPVIYPPIGAVASGVGGLTAARLLSLVFMLTASVFLYLAAKQLLGYVPACFAAALWALSEPAMRLGAFATFDAMSVSLTAFSAWLLIQAACRHGRVRYVAAGALALALANATAYSGIVIDPVVIAFALAVWIPRLGRRQATYCAVWFIGVLATVFVLVMAASHSWAGLLVTVVLRSNHHSGGGDSTGFILKNFWLYAGSSLIVAAIGVVAAVHTAKRDELLLLAVSGCAILIVPIAQIHAHTETSLDKHLAYGLWFASIVGGYGCSKAAGALHAIRPRPAVLCAVLAFAYPIADNWQAARAKQRSWADTSSLVTKLRPVVAQANGTILAPVIGWVAKYYTRQGEDWRRWLGTVPLAPAGLSQAGQTSYYTALLERSALGVIVLLYGTRVNDLPNDMVMAPQDGVVREKLLELIAANALNGPHAVSWLPALTLAIEADPAYRLSAVGPYNSGNASGTYAIWKKV